VVWSLSGSSPLMDALRPQQYPTFVDVVSSGLEHASSKLMLPVGIRFFRTVNGKAVTYEPNELSMPEVGQVIDGILALSPTSTKVDAPKEVYRDAAYVRELRRRAKILTVVFGFDFESNLTPLVGK
jgi:hypothetical protein